LAVYATTGNVHKLLGFLMGAKIYYLMQVLEKSYLLPQNGTRNSRKI